MSSMATSRLSLLVVGRAAARPPPSWLCSVSSRAPPSSGVCRASARCGGLRPSSSSSRQTLSREERRVRRAAEEKLAKSRTTEAKEGSATTATRVSSSSSSSSSRSSSSSLGAWVSVGAGTAVFSAGAWSLLADPSESEVARAAQESLVGAAITAAVARACAPFTNPSRDKLLCDWPPDYLNISPDVPCPHTLVIDVDETLVRATWDRRYGWRHAKRPGAEAFLREMAKYYEIVLFTSNIAGIAEPVLYSLDKEGCAMHRLYRDSTRFVRGTHCKDISQLNRDPRKIVVIDDDPRAVQLQPDNAILVKPYLDATDKTDTELEDITPFLAAIVNENVSDVPAALAKFSDRTAGTISREYADMLAKAKATASAVRNIGLGGFIARQRSSMPAPEHLAATGGLTAKDIVGDAPPDDDTFLSGTATTTAAAPKGRIWQRYADSMKDADQQHKRKLEAWQKVLHKKEQQKRLAAAERDAN